MLRTPPCSRLALPAGWSSAGQALDNINELVHLVRSDGDVRDAKSLAQLYKVLNNLLDAASQHVGRAIELLGVKAEPSGSRFDYLPARSHAPDVWVEMQLGGATTVRSRSRRARRTTARQLAASTTQRWPRGSRGRMRTLPIPNAASTASTPAESGTSELIRFVPKQAVPRCHVCLPAQFRNGNADEA